MTNFLKHVDHPVVGGTPSFDTGITQWYNYHAEVLGWYEGETLLEPDHIFEAGKIYTVRIRLTAASGYYFEALEYYNDRIGNSFSGNNARGTLLERGEAGEYIVFEASILARNKQAVPSVTVTTPVAGMKHENTVIAGGDVSCDVELSRWEVYDEGLGYYRTMEEGELFEVGKTYRPCIYFSTNDTFFIDSEMTAALINGMEGYRFSSGTKNDGLHILGFYAEFTVEAGESFDITVENGNATINESPVTEAGGGITVTITADPPEEGKAFMEWVVISGENVILANATASTTTFVMPAGNVTIQAVYRNTPHTITVEDGVSDLNEAGSGETVTITANEAPDGKYFAGWECIAGDVTFTDATAKTTTFVMSAEAVSIRAVYADKILLDSMDFTITVPANGENPSFVITSANPLIYTATVDYWYSNTTYENLTPESVFAYGEVYSLRFIIQVS